MKFIIILALFIAITPAYAEENFSEDQAPFLMRALNAKDIGSLMNANEVGLWCYVEKQKPKPEPRSCDLFRKMAMPVLNKSVDAIKMTEFTIRNLNNWPSSNAKDNHLETLQGHLQALQDGIALLRQHISENGNR